MSRVPLREIDGTDPATGFRPFERENSTRGTDRTRLRYGDDPARAGFTMLTEAHAS